MAEVPFERKFLQGLKVVNFNPDLENVLLDQYFQANHLKKERIGRKTRLRTISKVYARNADHEKARKFRELCKDQLLLSQVKFLNDIARSCQFEVPAVHPTIVVQAHCDSIAGKKSTKNEYVEQLLNVAIEEEVFLDALQKEGCDIFTWMRIALVMILTKTSKPNNMTIFLIDEMTPDGTTEYISTILIHILNGRVFIRTDVMLENLINEDPANGFVCLRRYVDGDVSLSFISAHERKRGSSATIQHIISETSLHKSKFYNFSVPRQSVIKIDKFQNVTYLRSFFQIILICFEIMSTNERDLLPLQKLYDYDIYFTYELFKDRMFTVAWQVRH